jgi:hypothetical protein
LNILLSELPHSLNIEGMEVEINCDFRTSLRFNELTKGKEKLNEKDIFKILELYFPIVKNTTDNSKESDRKLCLHVLENHKEALDKIFWFFRCGEEIQEDNQSEGKQSQEILSYEYDSDYIYTALLGQFKKDVTKENDLHWWSFKAMLNSLSEDTELRQRMKIRAADITKVPKEQQEYYRKMKKLYEIPHDKEEVKKNNEIAAIFK